MTDKVHRAVGKFSDAASALDAFMDENKEVVDKLFALIDTRNELVERARVAVKEARTSCGDFRVEVAKSPVFDTAVLKTKLPDTIFKRITKVIVDPALVEMLIERGEIAEEDVKGTYTVKEVVRCLGPKKWELK